MGNPFVILACERMLPIIPAPSELSTYDIDCRKTRTMQFTRARKK